MCFYNTNVYIYAIKFTIIITNGGHTTTIKVFIQLLHRFNNYVYVNKTHDLLVTRTKRMSMIYKAIGKSSIVEITLILLYFKRVYATLMNKFYHWLNWNKWILKRNLGQKNRHINQYILIRTSTMWGIKLRAKFGNTSINFLRVCSSCDKKRK